MRTVSVKDQKWGDGKPGGKKANKKEGNDKREESCRNEDREREWDVGKRQ